MIMTWTRAHTRKWIHQLESRLEDIDHYLKSTVKWCEDHYIYEDQNVFVLSFLTVLWVIHLRNETITYNELLEILGLEHLKSDKDYFYSLGNQFRDVDNHFELLELAFKKVIKD